MDCEHDWEAPEDKMLDLALAEANRTIAALEALDLEDRITGTEATALRILLQTRLELWQDLTRNRCRKCGAPER